MRISLHGGGTGAAKTIEVDEDKPLAALVDEHRGGWGEVLAISVQDAEEDLDLTLTLGKAGIREGQRLHLHRCRLVAVTVTYNGAKTHDFRANMRVRRVKDWAVSPEGFNIPERDAADLVLAYGNPLAPIPEGLHIGDLQLHDCRVSMSLVPIDFFNG